MKERKKILKIILFISGIGILFFGILEFLKLSDEIDNLIEGLTDQY